MEENNMAAMKECLAELKKRVTNHESCGWRMIAVPVREARAALGYIAHLEQSQAGSAQRTDSEAAGQAGLATSRDMTIARIVRDNICWVFDAAPQVLARIDDGYLESIIAKRAPIAAATEHAMQDAMLYGTGITRLSAEGIEHVPYADTLATPADAGAAQQPEAQGLAKQFGYPPILPEPADAGADEQTAQQQKECAPPFAAPVSQQAASGEVLTNSEIFELLVHIRPDAYGMSGCGPDYEGYDLACARAIEREVLARLSKPGAQAPMHKDVEWLMQCAEEAQSFPDIATKVRAHCMAAAQRELGQSAAQVTAEPVARLQEEISDRPFTKGEKFFDIIILDRARCFDGMELYAAPVSHSGAQVPSIASDPEFNKNMAGLPLIQYRAVVALVDRHIATHSAPADRDAIRNEALEEAARWVETYDGVGYRRAEAIRALKSMERAADAKGDAA